MDKIKCGTKVEFQGNIYLVIEDPGDNSLLVKRGGSRTPISIPKSQARVVVQEGRVQFDVSRKLNG